jgi:hypothetical protein
MTALARIRAGTWCLPAIAVVAIAVASSLAVDARGDFPLNDDWAYAHSVAWLAAEHRIRLSDWIAMNLLPQTLLGALATAIGGFSFTTLRHLTQIVAAILAALALGFFRAAGLCRTDAVIATLTLIAMPCWLPLADSYMTDLYGMLFALPAASLFVLALREPRPALVVAGTLFAVAGVLQRQVVLAVPAAFCVAWLAARPRRNPARAAAGVLPLIATAGAALAYHAYLVHGPGVPAAQQWLQGRVVEAVGKTLTNAQYRGWVGSNVLTLLAYLGLFASPFALWRGLPAGRGARMAIVALAALSLATMAATGSWPPWRGDQLLDRAGIGPFTLYDAQPRGLAPLDRSPSALWYGAGIVAAIGIAMLCRTGLAAVRAIAANSTDKGERLFLFALIGAYLAPFALTDYFDRYLLFVLPFVLALVALAEPAVPTRASRMLGIVVLVAMAGYGVMATHDYFAWNRARWDAIHAAERMGATPETLDGGFEYNGFHRADAKPDAPPPGRSWWWVKDDRFVVAFGPVEGYAERARFPVARWLPRTPAHVLLLERRAP